MIKLRYIAATAASTGLLTLGTASIVGAAPTSGTTGTGNVGSSGIPKSTFHQDVQNAETTVLNTSLANIQAAHKNKTFDQLLKNAGLTRKDFDQKMKSQLTTELTGQGYSQDQITIALQQKHINRLEHRVHHLKDE